MATFFLASFNATLRYIVDQRRELSDANKLEASKKADEKNAWEEASFKAKDGIEKRRRKERMKELRNGGGIGEKKKLSGTSGNSGTSAAPNAQSQSRIKQLFELEEEVNRQREHLGQEEQESLERKKHDLERRKQLERDDPTLGKFKTTQRPLDGFMEETLLEDKEEEEEEEVVLSGGDEYHHGEEGEGVVFHDRPSVQSHSRQSAAHSTPHPTTNSSTVSNLIADAHYAKAIRMLSSKFDNIKNGGNALPHAVYGGEYDQEINNKNGRGEGFVKMDPNKKKKRRKMKKKRRMKKASGAGGSAKKGGRNPFLMTSENSNWELPEDEPIFNVVLDVIYEWFTDTMDWIYETLGIELDHDDANMMNDGYGNYGMTYEEEMFSWRDTRVGSQLIWIYGKVVSVWSRQRTSSSSSLSQLHKKVQQAGKTTSSSSSTSSQQDKVSLSKADQTAREGLFHLEKAAELGHSEAQRMVANSLASGILPLSDHSLMHRLAEWQFAQSPSESNWTSILLQSKLQVPDDFSTGGQQLSRAILLWHLSAMDGNVESAMALGYRHLYSATGGSTLVSDLVADDKIISTGYHPIHGGAMQVGSYGTTPVSHYGVLGTCPTALAYYEAAAHGVMDELESGPTKGKVNPPTEEHRLAEIYTHGGASVALDPHNKPDELEEALQYYRMLASRNRSPEPDLVAAFTIANFYFHGYRGVKQDLRLALKYYEICGDYNHWEGGGQAGLMHVWGLGMAPEQRDLGKAYAYFARGTPGGVDGCAERFRRRKRQGQKKDGEGGEEVTICDRHCINGMGLLHLLGVEGLVDRNVNVARRWFEQGKDFGDPESIYNYAMLRLGWMVTELEDLPTTLTDESSTATKPGQKQKTPYDQHYMAHRSDTSAANTDAKTYTGPSASDHNVAIQELTRAASKGHLQAKHKLGMLYASGSAIPKKHGRPSKVVTPSCTSALRYFKSVADAGHTVSRRNRAAWKQYNAGDYESSLRNYLAAAETGNEIGQVNAAFLLEQGYCMGMTTKACTYASVRLWRAAARQGNLEACLRVGDFYYYGRMKAGPAMAKKDSGSDGETATLYDREQYLASLEAKAFYFIPGPYRWTRYILYPEELFDVTRKWVSRSVQNLREYASAKSSDASSNDKAEAETSSSQDTCDESEGTCPAKGPRYAAEDDAADEEEDEHMAIAAQYYRKAAEEHKSARANFNLGFMHEWGLGLTQDFPLAKRHYDLAGEDANMAAAIALWAMDVHQKTVKFGMMLREHARNNNLIAEGDVIASDDDESSPPPAANVESTPLGTVAPKKKKTTHDNDEFIAIEDVINDTTFTSKHTEPGHFPDGFETGNFQGLPWTAHLWNIEETGDIGAPFDGRYSAVTSAAHISKQERASLKLDVTSFNGGRICFYLFAEVALPWEDFRVYLYSDTSNQAFYQFTQGTTRYPGSWVDVCFEIPAGKHVLEWALAWPAYYDKAFEERKVAELIEQSRQHKHLPSGHVRMDNVRFYPFVYDNFETGDFSLQKWRQYGDGAPWVISDFNAHGRYSAHARPTIDIPNGMSNLELAVDL